VVGVRSADRRLCGLRFFLRLTLPNPRGDPCFWDLGFFLLKNRGPQRRGSALPPQIRAFESKGRLTRSIINPQRRICSAAVIPEYSFTLDHRQF